MTKELEDTVTRLLAMHFIAPLIIWLLWDNYIDTYLYFLPVVYNDIPYWSWVGLSFLFSGLRIIIFGRMFRGGKQ